MWESAGASLLVISALGGLVALIYKLRPDTAKIFVDSAKVSVEIADLTRDNLVEDVAALRSRLAEREREENRYRADVEARLAELSAQLRGERAEKEHLSRENAALRARVDELEGEVRSLKAANRRNGPKEQS